MKDKKEQKAPTSIRIYSMLEDKISERAKKNMSKPATEIIAALERSFGVKNKNYLTR